MIDHRRDDRGRLSRRRPRVWDLRRRARPLVRTRIQRVFRASAGC